MHFVKQACVPSHHRLFHVHILMLAFVFACVELIIQFVQFGMRNTTQLFLHQRFFVCRNQLHHRFALFGVKVAVLKVAVKRRDEWL